MTITSLAGICGLGFVLMLIILNAIYTRAGFPLTAGKPLETVTESLAAVGGRLKPPSIFVPAAWLCTTLFAAGLLSRLWRGEATTDAWALVGFAGVLMLNATFVVVEALRFGMVSAAAQHRGSVAGLWTFSNMLVGFNQVFLAVALLGFSVAGSSLGFIPAWHAWLGYVSAAVLFFSASTSPYHADGTNRTAMTGLIHRFGRAAFMIGPFGWGAWIAVSSIVLLTT